MAELTVQLVTPESVKYEGSARRVQLPAVQGEMGVLPHHVPLVTMLQAGRVEVISSEGNRHFQVEAGFATIANNQLVVLVDSAEELKG